jgi:hypothetical protein
MRLIPVLRVGVPIAALCLCAQGQNPAGQNPPSQAPPAKEATVEIKGLPPRATPGDYQDQAEMGTVTIAAEFQGHAVPTAQGNLTTEDYVTVETGFFGKPGERIRLSFGDFALRINGKKEVPGQPYGVILGNVKDPEWVPPEPEKPKMSNIFVGGEKEEAPKGQDKEPQFPPKVPIEVQHAMAQRVQKAALPEGDRALPVAGLVFFPYSGRTEKLHAVELIYKGAAGKATLTLQPQ